MIEHEEAIRAVAEFNQMKRKLWIVWLGMVSLWLLFVGIVIYFVMVWENTWRDYIMLALMLWFVAHAALAIMKMPPWTLPKVSLPKGLK